MRERRWYLSALAFCCDISAEKVLGKPRRGCL